MQLSPHDLHWARRRLPDALAELMKKHGSKLVIGGGYIRACAGQEPISDIDCFTKSQKDAHRMAYELAGLPEEWFALLDKDESTLSKDVKPVLRDIKRRVYETDNAFTVKGLKLPVQFIHRWTFPNPTSIMESFDFTVAKAVFWYQPDNVKKGEGTWMSLCDEAFYPDLAGKRLVYCSPVREEEPGGSLLRVLKFYQKGYRIPLDSFGRVIGRLLSGIEQVNFDKRSSMSKEKWEAQMGLLITGLLREVDPAIDPDHISHLPSPAEMEKQAATGEKP